MGLIDFIRGCFNPGILSTYNYIISSHEEAYKEWRKIQKPGTFSNSLGKSLSFRDKKYIVNHIDDILECEKKIAEEKAFNKRRQMVIYAASKYPAAFKALIEKLSMPPITDEVLLKKILPSIKLKRTIHSLSKDEYETLYEHIPSLPREEEIIQKQRKEEEIRLSFQRNILNNERRSKYYTSFFAGKNIDCENHEYIIEHLDELDNYITEQINTQYDILCRELPLGIEEYKQYRHYGENDIDFKERVIENESRVKKLDSAKKKYIELTQKYPIGLPAFVQYNSFDDGKNSASLSLEEIVECEHEISIFEEKVPLIKSYEKWINDQKSFAAYCRGIHNEIFSNWGCYYYDLSIPSPSFTETPKMIQYRIWQHFCESYCADASLDYSLSKIHQNRYEKDLPNLLNMQSYYKSSVFDKIIAFISNIKEKYGEILVLFGDSGVSKDGFNSYHLKYLENNLIENSIFYGSKLINPNVPILYKYIVVVDIISTNEHLLKQCEEITMQFKDYHPHIVFVSLMKEYSRQEMLSIINNEQNRIDKEKREEQERLEKQRKEEERIRREKEAKEKELRELMHCVSGWSEPTRSYVKCFSLYNYYPTTCEWEANEDEWEIRNLIWNFKASPTKNQSPYEIKMRHEVSLRRIIPDIERCLRYYFEDKITKLTFVCIPSSKAVVTQRRYEDFSKILCDNLGMTNAYGHVHVMKDGEAKRLGGTIRAEYSLDEEYFKDKYILLFDDVITTGGSMERFKNALQNTGARVIAGVSLGRTRHERQYNNPIDLINSNSSTSKSNQYDLPF